MLHALHTPFIAAWVMFALGVLPGNILFWRIGSVVRSKGLYFPYFNWGLIRGLHNFHAIISAEVDPVARQRYRRLAVWFYLVFGWELFWFAAFMLAGTRSI